MGPPVWTDKTLSGKFDEKAFFTQFAHLTITPTDSMETQLLKQSTADAIVAAEQAKREANFYGTAIYRQNDKEAKLLIGN